MNVDYFTFRFLLESCWKNVTKYLVTVLWLILWISDQSYLPNVYSTMEMGLEDDDSDDLIEEELELRSCFVQGPSCHSNDITEKHIIYTLQVGVCMCTRG